MTSYEFNPYEILGVDNSTSLEAIKKAYKARSKELHPDHGGRPEDFSNLKKAFDILTDPAKRSLYDEYGIADALAIEDEARLVAVQIVVSALDGLPDSCDLDKEISAVCIRCLDGLKEQEAAAKQSRDTLQRRLNGIQEKPVDDFLTPEIQKIIEQHNRTMKQIQLNYRIHETAFRMVREYRFDITKIPFMGDNYPAESTYPGTRGSKASQARKDLYRSLGMWTP
jgi:curved DNA-binding protein CbpA